MNCGEMQKLIPEYIDGDLQPVEIDAVKQHLEQCAACQKEATLYKGAWQMLNEWKDIEPEPGYISRFWTKVAMEKPWYQEFLTELKDKLNFGRLAPVFVTLSILLLVSAVSLQVYFQPDGGNADLLTSLNDEEVEFVENLELAENYEIIEDLDFWEDLEILEAVETEGQAAS